jgi:hypothetical protein
MTPIRICPVCGSDDFELSDSYRGTHEVFSGLMRAHCRSCSMAFATPMPSEETLSEYNAAYFATAHGGTPASVVGRAFFSGIAQLRLAYLERYLSERRVSVSRLLEFGPGPGFFAASWLKRHPGTAYMAHETDLSCHADLDRLGIQLVGSVSSAEVAAPVDLVVMSHVLEHVSEPKVFLEHAIKSLRKGGVLFIEVPCLDYEHKLIDEPHLLFFDKKPMQHLLHTSGFTDIKVGYFGQQLDNLRSASFMQAKWMSLRSRLIAIGLVAPFSWEKSGMETLNSLERAVVAPFRAHCESSKPAWWLRAVARKQ